MPDERNQQLSNPFAENPMTQEEYATFLLAEAVHVGIRDPRTGPPRGQMVTWLDTWYPGALRCVQKLREAGDRGVVQFDRERQEGQYE